MASVFRATLLLISLALTVPAPALEAQDADGGTAGQVTLMASPLDESTSVELDGSPWKAAPRRTRRRSG